MVMSKRIVAASFLIAGGLLGQAGSIAAADERSGLNIGDSDSVFVDGKTFQIIPGRAKSDATAQIKNLAARELGPGAIIIRSGDKLYIADAQSQAAFYDPRSINPAVTGAGSPGYNRQVETYAYDPRSIDPVLNGGIGRAYDPRSINPVLTGGGSPGYNRQVETYAYDPRSINPALTGGGSVGYNQQVGTYAYDPRSIDPVLNGGIGRAYDPRSINPVLTGGGSLGYNRQVETYAYDPRSINPGLNGGIGRAYDPRSINPVLTGGGSPGYNQQIETYAYDPRLGVGPVFIYDPDYVEYRLKQEFAENWTPSGSAMGNGH
jgi:hypothetical protein